MALFAESLNRRHESCPVHTMNAFEYFWMPLNSRLNDWNNLNYEVRIARILF